jgi:hypothetical protein
VREFSSKNDVIVPVLGFRRGVAESAFFWNMTPCILHLDC